MTGPDWTDRFWAAVNKEGPTPVNRPELGPCWVWKLSVQERRGGYGQFRLERRTLRAHVVAYELMVGPVPQELELDHLCRTPRCVNPTHLEPVTRRENFLRGEHPTAVSVRAGVCQKGLHEMTDANTITRPNRPGKRECRSCENTRQREGYHAKRRAA